MANRRIELHNRGMLECARRPIGSFLIVLLALNLIQCTQIKREGVQAVVRPGAGDVTMKNVVGVTLKNGRDIRFDDRSRALLQRDTIQARVDNQPLAIPSSDVEQVWVRSVNGNRTTLLVIGLTLAAFVAFAAFGASQIQYDLP